MKLRVTGKQINLYSRYLKRAHAETGFSTTKGSIQPEFENFDMMPNCQFDCLWS
jgi:hypothetical protein